MAYATYTASYGSANAGADVHIFETSTGKPATILAATTGGVLSETGKTTLNASGDLSVVIDTAKTWTVSVNSPNAAVQQKVDKGVVLTTLNSTTASLNVKKTKNVQMVVSIGTATTPPALQLEGSEDNGTTWYPLGSPLTAVASSSVQTTISNIHVDLVRARVSTAGNTVVAGYVLLKGF